MNVVLCLNPLLVVEPEKNRGFDMNTYGLTVRQGFNARFAEPSIEKTGQQIMQEMQDAALARGANKVVYDVKPGQSKFYVGTMGLPGQERVISVAREEWFGEGRNPTAASVRDALVKKYGAPSSEDSTDGTYRLRWSHDPAGAQIPERSMAAFDRCRGVANPNAEFIVSEGCGVVIAAEIESMASNADLAKLVRVGSVDHARTVAGLNSTQQGLAQLDAQRRAREVDKAARGGGAVKF